MPKVCLSERWLKTNTFGVKRALSRYLICMYCKIQYVQYIHRVTKYKVQ